MAVIAKECPDITVTVVDVDAKRIEAWNSDNLPIFEPGLYEIVKEVRGKNLFFTTDVEYEVQRCGIIFLAVNVLLPLPLPFLDSHQDLWYRRRLCRQLEEPRARHPYHRSLRQGRQDCR